MALLRRPVVSFALFLAAAAIALEPLLTVSQGSRTPGSLHWWCSAAALRSSVHAAGGSRGLDATLLTALEVHWPHFLPILLGLATLVYLRRADARYRLQGG